MNDLIQNPAHESRELLGDVLQTQVSSMAVQIARAELDQAIVTARQYPRSINAVMKNIITLATLSKKVSTDCVYALPRAGKAIRGPSVRLAEIIAQQWGNCHIGSRVIGVDLVDKVVIAEGVFHDLQTGTKRIAQVRRKITDRYGKLFNEDMINVTGNAAASIAMREAVLKGVPRGIWEEAYDRCEQVIRGDVTTLTERRDGAYKAFAAFGVTRDQMFEYLEIDGEKDMTLDHLATLTATHSALKSGEASVEDYFKPARPAAPRRDTGAAAKAEAEAAKDAKMKADAAAANAKAREKAKAEAGTAEEAQKAAAPEADPEPETVQTGPETVEPERATRGKPKSDEAEPLIPDDRHMKTYEKVMQDALDANNIDTPLQYHAAAIDAMQKEAPALYRRLMAELDAFAVGDEEQ